MLRTIEGETGPNAVFRKFLGLIRDAVDVRPDLWRAAVRVLERLAIQERVPATLVSQCSSFDDACILAEQGSYGTLAAVEAEFLAFLAMESEPFASNVVPIEDSR